MGDFTADLDFMHRQKGIVPGSSQQPKCGSFTVLFVQSDNSDQTATNLA
jgi:hypothetical protein